MTGRLAAASSIKNRKGIVIHFLHQHFAVFYSGIKLGREKENIINSKTFEGNVQSEGLPAIPVIGDQVEPETVHMTGLFADRRS